LIISGHGAGLNVQNGSLIVRDGFTHYPQKRVEHRLFPRDPNMPSRIVILDGSGSLSFDAMDWLSAQQVPLIRINWRGEVQSVFGAVGYSADPKKVAQQRALQASSGVKIARQLIHEKVTNSVHTLIDRLPPSSALNDTLSKLNEIRSELRAGKQNSTWSVLGAEGKAATIYFETWQDIIIRWKGIGRRPIPSDWHKVGPRTTNARQKIYKRNASHPVNAMLNYAYAVLQNRLQGEIIGRGLDPSIGFLHTERPNRPALVFDLMEPFRPVIDRTVLAFAQSNVFSPSDFTLRPDDVCRLNPELARHIIGLIEVDLPSYGAFGNNILQKITTNKARWRVQ